MNSMLLADATNVTAPDAPVTREPSRRLYFSLYQNPRAHLDAARAYLAEQVAAVQDLPADLPPSLDALSAWVERRTDAVGAQYRDYLAARKNGASRRYFSCRA